MRIDTRALTITLALLWGGAMLLVALAQMVWPAYGRAFLEAMASVYPGYHGPDGFGAALVAGLYGALDGGLAGLVGGWLYNRLAGDGAGS